MAITRPCPKCQAPLSIPEPIPEKLQCPKCAAVIMFKKPAAAAPSPPAPSAPAPEPAKVSEPPKSSPEIALSKPAAPPPAPQPAAPEPEKLELIDDEPPAKKEPPKPAPAPKQAASGGFVSLVHTIIPKPVLFAFYGAIGGFLGVLFFGEIFMFFLQPEPQKPTPPLAMAVSDQVTVFPDGKNSVKVKIARHGITGPVRIEAVNPPRELDVPEVTIAADKDEAELVITAIPKADPDVQHVVGLRAVAVDNDKVKDEASLKVDIGKTPAMVRLTASPQVTIYAGTQNSFKFKIARDRFEGPVRVQLLNVPKGVQSPVLELPETVSQGIMPVSMDRDALGKENKPRYYNLPLEVRSIRDQNAVHRETIVQLNLEPQPGRLQIAAPGNVTVYPGTTNKFTVKISRQEFDGPVEIEVSGGPRGATFSRDVVIPAGKTEAEILITAAQDMETGVFPKLRVIGKTNVKGEDLTAEAPLTLHITPPPPAVLLAVSPKVPIFAGGEAKFGVKIGRARFTGPVTVEAQGMNPAYGVSIPTITIPADKSEGEMKVIVSQNALAQSLPFPMPVTIIARRAQGPHLPASEKTTIDIKPPPSDLAVNVAPEVDVYQAGKCKFTVKIARAGFLGNINVKLNNVPPGVTFTPISNTPTDIIIQGEAKIDVDPKKYDIEIAASGPKAPDGKVPAVAKNFTLNVKKFDPAVRPPLDIVFVLDITQSLDPQIAGLRDGIGQFVKGLQDRDLNPRIGIIGFRDINYTDFPDFERPKFNGELFTTDVKAFAAAVGKFKAQGGGDPPESSLDAVVEASKYPFRPDAMKVLLLITDEEPQTKGNSVTMKLAQKALKEKKIDQVHLIVKSKDLKKYVGLQDGLKGGFFDFDDATKGIKGQKGFASLLPHLGAEIATAIGAQEAKTKDPPAPEAAKQPDPIAGEKPLEPRPEASPSSPPPVPPSLPKAGEAPSNPGEDPQAPQAAEVSPPSAAPATLQSVSSTGRYAEKDRGWLIAAQAMWTAFLAAGIALMLVGAQKRYLSQAWPSIGEAVKSLLAGIAAGVIAGIIGQWFFQLTSGASWFELISRVIAWTIVGGLLGAAMSFFVPNMQRKRAVLGGCLGGFIGVLGFLVVNWLAGLALGSFARQGFIDVLARLLGALLVGLFIGIMVALAEIASRRYWLEIAFGPREVRTVTLGADTVALGGDEKQVGVYVPNAPPKALGFRIERNRVVCEDFSSGRTNVSVPGEEHKVAAAKVRVCSATEATPTGASLKLLVARDVALMVGMPMTADDIPGLEPQGADGVVAIVSPRPNNPKIFLLRNRSKQPWTVTEADGKPRKVEPGMSVELLSKCEIDFGQVKAVLDPNQETGTAAQETGARGQETGIKSQ